MKKIALVSEKISDLAIETIGMLGYEIVKVPTNPNTYSAIGHHPDINCFFYKEKAILSPYCYGELKEKLASIGFNVFCGETLTDQYPGNVKLNGILLDGTFIHKSLATDKILLDHLGSIKQIDVNQGYTKCSCVLVDDKSIITSDPGLYDKLRASYDVLLVESEQVKLDGFDYGFIGGASGHSDQFVFFNGNISNHSSYKEIEKFIISKGKFIIELREQTLEDLGSFFFLER